MGASGMNKEEFIRSGHFVLKDVFTLNDISEMQKRLDSIIAGIYSKHGRRFYQESASGSYQDISHKTYAYAGPTKDYRKIADLEFDDLILSKVQNKILAKTCQNLIGDNISLMRLTMMNKARNGGTDLPWHQDMHKDWPTDIMPKLAFWFPLDQLSQESGTLQIVQYSHTHGIIGNGHMLEPCDQQKYVSTENIFDILINVGDVLLFDTCTLHRSGINKTNLQRRAINGILIPGFATHTKKNIPYPMIYGINALQPHEVAKMDTIN